MKETKNVNVTFGKWGTWVARNNGEVVAEGYGIDTMDKAVEELKERFGKKVKINYVGGLC
jgi:hypothetical protein